MFSIDGADITEITQLRWLYWHTVFGMLVEVRKLRDKDVKLTADEVRAPAGVHLSDR